MKKLLHAWCTISTIQGMHWNRQKLIHRVKSSSITQFQNAHMLIFTFQPAFNPTNQIKQSRTTLPNTQSKSISNKQSSLSFIKTRRTPYYYYRYTKWTNKRVTRGQCHRSVTDLLRCTRSLPTSSSNLVQLRTAATPSTSYSFSSIIYNNQTCYIKLIIET